VIPGNKISSAKHYKRINTGSYFVTFIFKHLCGIFITQLEKRLQRGGCPSTRNLPIYVKFCT
jgi:hypothetical protein